MVDKGLLAAKLADLADRVQRVRTRTPTDAAALAADRDTLDIVAFNLMLCVQICADIASHLIADEGWPAASSLAEGFTRLQERTVVSPATAEALRNAIGFRNVVAHGYSRVDVDMTFRAATEGLGDLEAFAREVASWTAGVG
jgi:uncharacterized protein YutE (UPF0331/DUF86 family)